jgi:exopolysaccharide production protein ExoZ
MVPLKTKERLVQHQSMIIEPPTPVVTINHSASHLKFGGIEAARGVAAVLVAAYHASRLVAQPRYAGVPPAAGLFGDFNAGVDFFFVLSGFLITWVHWFDIGQPNRLGHYFVRRFTRIYPAYWVVLLPTLLASLFHIGSSATTTPTPAVIICSILLLPNAVQPVLGVAWTLVFEVFFYCMFAFAMLAGKRAAIVAILWGCLIVIYNTVAPPPSFPGSFFLSPYNLEFLIGVAVASLLRQIEFPFGRRLATIGAVLFVALMLARVERLMGDSALALRLAFGLCAAMFVIGTVEIERLRGSTVPAWLALLGAASYSVYLVHSLIEPVVMLAAWPHIKGISPTLITIALTCLATAGGILFHVLVEKPLMLQVRRATTRHGKRLHA